MTAPILHITSRASWSAAQVQGIYSGGVALDDDARFIHCSTPAQTTRVANHLFRGQHELVILVIDPSRLKSELRWEPGIDIDTELFPHIYGALNLDAVIEMLDFEPEPDGLFSFPEMRNQ